MNNATENGVVVITYGEEVKPSERFKSRRQWGRYEGFTRAERLERSLWRAIDALEGSQESLMTAGTYLAIGCFVAGYVALFAIVAAWGMS